MVDMKMLVLQLRIAWHSSRETSKYCQIRNPSNAKKKEIPITGSISKKWRKIVDRGMRTIH